MKIQDGAHSSVIDARASLALYRIVEKEWENYAKQKSSSTYQNVKEQVERDLKSIKNQEDLEKDLKLLNQNLGSNIKADIQKSQDKKANKYMEKKKAKKERRKRERERNKI